MKTTHSLRTIRRLIVALLVSPRIALLAQTNLPTVAVAPTAPQGLASWQPAIGEGLAHMFISELNKLGKFHVLESVALDDLRSEQALVQSGEALATEGVAKGEWHGADYTFKSFVSRFGTKESSMGGGGRLPVPIPIPNPFRGGRVTIDTREHEVQIEWRIIDNQTRRLVPGASGNAVGKEVGRGFNFGTGFGSGFQNSREFHDSALGKATVKAIAEVIR